MEEKLFKLSSKYKPSGDQPKAIEDLCGSLKRGSKYSTLVGVTGSGKTFTMANVIAEMNRPALIISHNKTLSAQLYAEFKEFFPENAVEYFVSYYDYYQPEAYIPQTDTYIEKDSSINDEIEKLRISAASALVSRRDVIVVATVSCIYGLGSPEDFRKMMIPLRPGIAMKRSELVEKLTDIHYERNNTAFERGLFRVRGDVVDVFPAYLDCALRIEFFGDEIDCLKKIDPVTGSPLGKLDRFDLYPATGFVTPKDSISAAIPNIRAELDARVAELESQNKLVEAQRIKMRTEQDLDMLAETGFCTGIENYSRHLAGRPAGSRPWCLLDFFPKDTILFIDESHVTYPQIRGMYNGDRARKERLIEYGFRLPSALDNRPLRPAEFDSLTGQTIFVSATPAPFELSVSDTVAEQIIRPTGLLDPEMIIRPIAGQVEDCAAEIKAAAEKGIKIYTIGIGSPEGAPIPIDGNFIKDEKGNMVVSKLDEATLEQIALSTGGAYIRATNRSLGLDEIVKKINEVEKKQLSSSVFEDFNEQYQYLIGIGLLLLLIEFVMLERKSRILSRLNIFRKQ